ncbi:hypothetical protein P167DRAFT_378000 [Morchella conica CCBAS932]|uniref:Uncharacterized protein n=1 Tax=Morchella conica CCBAS932 TaxID=1392247 RepID=A0A3N4L569_9PEZI|nr:hypothetical protein P167DRAFT_378000 [Morchella conica CCBAS932]
MMIPFFPPPFLPHVTPPSHPTTTTTTTTTTDTIMSSCVPESLYQSCTLKNQFKSGIRIKKAKVKKHCQIK